jgi:hypothetical protein
MKKQLGVPMRWKLTEGYIVVLAVIVVKAFDRDI